MSNKLIRIGSYAFSGCTNLASVTIPDSVTTIGEGAFSGCTGLTSVTISNSVTTLDNIFFDCTGLTSVTIPYGVRIIDGTFSGCTNLASVTIPDSVTTIGSDAFNECTNLRSIAIPDSVTTIGHGAFYECENLTSVTIPDKVKTIEEYAFSRCDEIASVTFGSSVVTIGASAFSGNSLRSITIPDSVVTIGASAFSGNSLRSITIGSGVTAIGLGAFSYVKFIDVDCRTLFDNNATDLAGKTFFSTGNGNMFRVQTNAQGPSVTFCDYIQVYSDDGPVSSGQYIPLGTMLTVKYTNQPGYVGEVRANGEAIYGEFEMIDDNVVFLVDYRESNSNYQPGYNQPEYDQPGYNQPEYDQPGYDRSSDNGSNGNNQELVKYAIAGSAILFVIALAIAWRQRHV